MASGLDAARVRQVNALCSGRWVNWAWEDGSGVGGACEGVWNWTTLMIATGRPLDQTGGMGEPVDHRLEPLWPCSWPGSLTYWAVN